LVHRRRDEKSTFFFFLMSVNPNAGKQFNRRVAVGSVAKLPFIAICLVGKACMPFVIYRVRGGVSSILLRQRHIDCSGVHASYHRVAATRDEGGGGSHMLSD
jgi:hypothetical protein